MAKKEKHEKAEEFRGQIALPVQRNATISELLTKSSYDESDKLRINILFQKKAYLEGCETTSFLPPELQPLVMTSLLRKRLPLLGSFVVFSHITNDGKVTSCEIRNLFCCSKSDKVLVNKMRGGIMCALINFNERI